MTDETTSDENKPNADKPGFQHGSVEPGDKDLPANSQENMSERLDEALEEVSPSSDPVSVKITK